MTSDALCCDILMLVITLVAAATLVPMELAHRCCSHCHHNELINCPKISISAGEGDVSALPSAEETTVQRKMRFQEVS